MILEGSAKHTGSELPSFAVGASWLTSRRRAFALASIPPFLAGSVTLSGQTFQHRGLRLTLRSFANFGLNV